MTERSVFRRAENSRSNIPNPFAMFDDIESGDDSLRNQRRFIE